MKKRILCATAALIGCAASMLVLVSVWRPRAPTNAGVGAWGPSSYRFPASEPGTQPSPGSEQGSVAMGIWFHNSGHSSDPAFVVWVGEEGGGQLAAHTEPLAQGTHERICIYEGTVANVSVECRTSDGMSEMVKIGGERHELDKGALFLVLNTGGRLKVKQLKLAMLNLKPEGALSPDQITHEYLQGLARTNPEIHGFFAADDPRK